jgi:hypothetical protein
VEEMSDNMFEVPQSVLEKLSGDNKCLRQALFDLITVIDASTYGEEGIHHHTCPAPDHGKCTCGAYAAVDVARATLEGKARIEGIATLRAELEVAKTMNTALETECDRLNKALAWISPKEELPPDCSTVEFEFYRSFGQSEFGHGYVTTNPPLDPLWHLVADGRAIDLKPYQHVIHWRPIP